MTRTSWRTLAGFLVLGIGGFVVLANDKPQVQQADGDRCCPCPQACPCPVACPQPCATQACCPPTECPCPDLDMPVANPVPPLAACVVPVPVTPQQTATPIKVVSWNNTVCTVPYRVRMEMIGTTTQLELLRGDDVTLRIQCDRVDLQMPTGGIQAIGKCCVSSNGLDVRCNRMAINWSNGDICMEGQVQINCQHGQLKTIMSAECVNCRLNSMGTGLDFMPAEAPKSIQD